MGVPLSKLFHSLLGPRECRLLMVGLDAAGKTTILYKLKLGEVVTTIPTVGFNVDTVNYRNINFTVWDIGGQDKIRPLWRHYFHGIQGVVFVIDSNDRTRVNEAKDELEKLLYEEELKNATILVLANKQDLPYAMDISQLTQELELPKVRRKWYVQGCCATKGDGLFEGLEWLSQNLPPSV